MFNDFDQEELWTATHTHQGCLPLKHREKGFKDQSRIRDTVAGKCLEDTFLFEHISALAGDTTSDIYPIHLRMVVVRRNVLIL